MSDAPSPAARDVPLPYDAARRHLLLSFPNLDASDSGHDALNRLVEGAVHHLLAEGHETTIITVTEVVDAIRAMSGLRYESAEVIAALTRLEKLGHVSFRHEAKRAFVFSERRHRDLCADAAYRRERLAAVRQEWGDDVRLRHDLSDEQVETLWIALEQFIALLMNNYAAEAAAVLYQTAGGHERFAEVLAQRAPRIADVVQSELHEIARQEFPRFFEKTSAARTDYIAHRLRGTFVFHLLNLDPAASELVRENVSKKTLYLDTNFLFRLLGFDGPTKAYGPMAVVEMSRSLQCKLVVAEETVHEFLRRLRNEVRTLRANPITQEVSQRLIAEHPGDEYTFMRAYFREYLDGKIRTPDQFEQKYSNLTQLLREYGIEIDETAEIDEQDEKDDAILDLQSAFNTWTGQQRHPDGVAHDAFMLTFVREQRGRRDKRASEVKVWLLTYDRALTAFAVHRAGPDHLPVVMLAEDWLQIARPFLPRTADYDTSFVSLLQFPVAFDDPSLVKLNEMVEALQRLDNMRDVPAPVIAGMVSDGAMLNRIRLAQDQGAVQRLVEVQAAAYAVEQEKKVERLTQEKNELVDRVGQLEQVTDALRRREEAAKETAATVTGQRDDAAGRLEEVLRGLPDQIAAAQRAGEDASDRRWKERRKEEREQAWAILRGVGCAVLWFVLVAGLAWRVWTRPSAQTPLPLVVSVLTLCVASYALFVLARHGRKGDPVSKSADVAGVLTVILVYLQSTGILPSSPPETPGTVTQGPTTPDAGAAPPGAAGPVEPAATAPPAPDPAVPTSPAPAVQQDSTTSAPARRGRAGRGSPTSAK